MAELALDDDEEVDDTPLVFKRARTSTSVESPVPLTVVPPPPPPSEAPKRKRTGRTKSTIATLKRHKPSKDLEAQEKAQLEAVVAESLRIVEERMAKEKADAEALEAALRLSKDEATIHIASEDSDDTIQKILRTPINEDFLQSSAPSSSSVPP